MVLGPRLELFQMWCFLICGEVVPSRFCTLFGTFQNPKCSPDQGQSEKTPLRADLRSRHFEAFVTYRNVSAGIIQVSFWSHLDHLPRVFQTVVPVALRKSPYITILEKSRNVPNGLLKMCPRLEPQQHFEAECCSGIANRAVARVSCMSVCKMRPRLKPQHHFEVACCNGIAFASCILGVSQGGRRL